VSSCPSKLIEGFNAVPEANTPVCALIVVPENEVPVTLVKTPLVPVNVVKEAVVPVAVTKCPLVVETVVPVIVPLTYTLSPDKVPVIKGEVIIVSKLPD